MQPKVLNKGVYVCVNNSISPACVCVSAHVFMCYLCVCECEFSGDVGHVAFLRVAAHLQVPVIPHLWGVRPVLVTLGLEQT